MRNNEEEIVTRFHTVRQPAMVVYPARVAAASGDIARAKGIFFPSAGVGRVLALAIIQEARKIGYSRVRLDTVPSMKDAQAIYESLGFPKIPPYCHNPVPGAIFLELNLALRWIVPFFARAFAQIAGKKAAGDPIRRRSDARRRPLKSPPGPSAACKTEPERRWMEDGP